MHPAVEALLNSLSKGKVLEDHSKGESGSTIGKLARVYEVARNAMEYRADHLVRRAAIERIIRRKLVFAKNTEELSEELLTELKWAMYMTEVDEEKVHKEEIKVVLDKYMTPLESGKFQKDWILGLISAEIEEKFNPNVDYQRFTTFAFNFLKQRVTLDEKENVDLVLYVAVDRIFSQSDEQQISYHLYKLVRSQAIAAGNTEEAVFFEAWNAYNHAMKSRVQNKLTAYVRRQMGPLVLLRDLYFSKPEIFADVVRNKDVFIENAKATLSTQLLLMAKRIRTATIRSLVYVFLTKMLITVVFELPLERLINGHIAILSLGVNLIVPVLVMLGLTATARLPKPSEQERLINKSWQVVSDFDHIPNPWEKYPITDRSSRVAKYLFTGLYGLLFLGIFAGIMRLLLMIGYNFLNLIVFLFFLSVVSFFAFRIRQTAQVYYYRGKGISRTSLADTFMLPIVVVGGWLSMGVSKLNFLVFVFDFVLEAPFKIILKFLDSWMAFLSNRRDEVVG